MKTPRWEDFEYSYKKNESGVEDNPFSYLGMGWVPEMFDPEADDSPHMAVEKIDPEWARFKGIRCGTWEEPKDLKVLHEVYVNEVNANGGFANGEYAKGTLVGGIEES
jgi:hypothetical protein